MNDVECSSSAAPRSWALRPNWIVLSCTYFYNRKHQIKIFSAPSDPYICIWKIPRITMGPSAAANALIDTELWIVIQASQCPRLADGAPPAIGCISLQASRVAREH